MIFGLFGLQWVMPKRVIDLFSCWYGSVGRHSVIWKAIPHCIMWCLWREWNARIFEDCELSVVKLKLHFYRSLLDWMSVTGLFRLSNMLDLIDNCSFWASCILSPCAQLVCLVFSIKFIIYQKKKNQFLNTIPSTQEPTSFVPIRLQHYTYIDC